MIFNLYNVAKEDLEKIEQLEQDNPELVVRTITAGFDGSICTEVIAITPAAIQAIGAVIAAIIMAYATKKSSENKAPQKDINLKLDKPFQVTINTDDGETIVIDNVEELSGTISKYKGAEDGK